MTENVIDNIINSITAIIVALIAGLQLRNNSRVKRIRNQVENDHTTNLREEQDIRYRENTNSISQVLDMQKVTLDVIVAVRQDQTVLRKQQTKLERKLEKHIRRNNE